MLFKGIFRAAVNSPPTFTMIEMLWKKCDIACYYPLQIFRFSLLEDKLEGIWEKDEGHCCQTAQISVHLRRLQWWGERNPSIKLLKCHCSSHACELLKAFVLKSLQVGPQHNRTVTPLRCVQCHCCLTCFPELSQRMRWCSESGIRRSSWIKDMLHGFRKLVCIFSRNWYQSHS